MTIRSKSEWQALIDKHTDSGLNLKAFCAQEDLNYDWFGRKRSQLLKQAGSSTAPIASAFVPAKISTHGNIEIRCGHLVCRLPTQTPVAYVAELLRAL